MTDFEEIKELLRLLLIEQRLTNQLLQQILGQQPQEADDAN